MKKDYSALIWGLLFVAVGIIFGGNALDIWDIDIFLPDNVRVEIISGTPILGGFEHKINRNALSGPKVRIKYTAVLGGIEVK